MTRSIAPDIRLTSLLQYSTMALYCFVPGPHELEYNPGGKARPKRGTFLKLKVCEKVGKSISFRTLRIWLVLNTDNYKKKNSCFDDFFILLSGTQCEVLASNRLMGISRWMGSQLNGRIDYNKVVFSIGLLGSYIFESLGVRNSGKLKWEDSRPKKSHRN